MKKGMSTGINQTRLNPILILALLLARAADLGDLVTMLSSAPF